MNHIGFTGTRWGMTDAQKETVKCLLRAAMPCTLHHGDCIGSDSDAHVIARNLNAKIVIHPPFNTNLRAYEESDDIREPRGYLARDRDIVLSSSVVIATPYNVQETRGGTWYTITFAKEMEKPVIIVWPNGDHT